MDKAKQLVILALFGIFGIFVMSIVFGSWYTVDQSERGVILRNGKFIGLAEPGLGFKLPIVDSVVKISVQTHLIRFTKMSTYSRDQQPAELVMSVNYRIPESMVRDVYVQYDNAKGLVDRIITPRIYEWLKNIFGQFNAVTSIQERQRLNAEVKEALIAATKGAPVIIEGVQIENIDFSKEYEKSIEQRMLAEVEVQRLRQNLDREKVQADIKVTQAKASADAVKLAAEAEAARTTMQGNAEATAIAARGKALAENPSLVALVQAEKWDGKLPQTMIPGGAVPMLGLGR